MRNIAPRIIPLCLSLVIVLFFGASLDAQSRQGSTNSIRKPVDDEWTLRGHLLANPRNKNAHSNLCALLERQGKYRQSVDERKAWLEDNPEDIGELISLKNTAGVMLNDPEYDIAVTKILISKLDPQDFMFGWANYYLGKQLVERDRVNEAIPFLAVATRTNEESEYLVEFGSALVRAGQVDEGIQALHKAVEVYPAHADVHARLGDALAIKGDKEGQETEHKAACNLDKSNPVRFTTLAGFKSNAAN